MQTRLNHLMALCAALFAAGASAPLLANQVEAKYLVAEEQWPAGFAEALRREGRATKGDKVTLDGGRIQLVAGGKLLEPARQLDDGAWYLRTDIGTEAPMECWIRPDHYDIGTASMNVQIQATGVQEIFERVTAIGEELVEVITDTVERILADQSAAEDTLNELMASDVGEELAAKFDETDAAVLRMTRVLFYDADVVNDAALLVTEWMYGGEGTQLPVGLSKVRAALREDVSFVCGHNEVGYRATFERAFGLMAYGARIKVDSAPVHREIYRHSIRGIPVSVSTWEFYEDAIGARTVYRSHGMRALGGQLQQSVIYEMQQDTDRDGFVQAVQSSASKFEAPALNRSLSRDEKGVWYWQVEREGEERTTVLEGDVRPLGELGQRRLFRELRASDDVYSPEFDYWDSGAEKFVTGVFELTKRGRRSNRVFAKIGDLTFVGTMDANGAVLEGHITGAISEFVQLKHSAGELPLKR